MRLLPGQETSVHKRNHWQLTGDALLWTVVAKRDVTCSMDEPLKKSQNASPREEQRESGPLACTCCHLFWIKYFLGDS